jgi:hypothetical protein
MTTPIRAAERIVRGKVTTTKAVRISHGPPFEVEAGLIRGPFGDIVFVCEEICVLLLSAEEICDSSIAQRRYGGGEGRIREKMARSGSVRGF